MSSTTIDQRVVEMKFDNKQFENGVKTSMSTLDKLKQKLNLSGASKGLEEVNAAAKKIDLSGLSGGIETVRAKFSALEVMGVTALANITNSAVNTGRRLISALTIDPVRDGMAEYETQMNAVQTILANTQKEGTNVTIVNKALDELNTYADKTIYNFTEMTRNIGTFTAAGVKLDTSVSSIKGIANLAAVSGSTSQQASTAMYQLSQAIAAGTVKLMDWNSVVNAGMGGQVFQDALVRTAEHLQTGAKAAIAAKGSFRESLQTGWLTTEVLTQTLDQFSTAADTQQEYEDAVKKFIEQGYSQEEATQMADMAKTAGEAATKVKTFTQLIDTLKEALGSGWTTTWRLVIGDFEEAKELWTKVSDVLSDFINKSAEARNRLLESALGKAFTGLTEKMAAISEPVGKAIDSLKDLESVVDDVILGKFGNGKERFDALAEAGQNFYRVQNKVNETLGNSYRYTDEQIAEQDKLLGIQGATTESTGEEASETVKLTDEKKKLIKELSKLSDSELKLKGYHNEQIEALHELRDAANKLGMPMDEFIDKMDDMTGRWVLIDSFQNIGTSLINVFKAVSAAWNSIFTPMSADTLFDIIAGFHKFTEKIKINSEETAKLKRTFKGLFALLDIITTFVSGGFKLAFKAVSAILGAFDMDVLDLTANIGDMLVGLRDFILDNELVTEGFKLLGDGVKMVADALKDLYDYVSGLPKVQEFIESIKNVDLKDVGHNIIAGLKNGLKDGLTSIPDTLIEIGSKLLSSIKEVLGIHSPSTEMYDVGKFSIEGLVNGLSDGLKDVKETVFGIGAKVLEWVKGFDWNKVFAVGVSAGLLVVVHNLSGTLNNLTAPLGGLGDMFSGVGKTLSGVGTVLTKSAKSIKKILNSTAKVVKSFSKVLNAKAFEMKADGIKTLAISLAILAGSVYLLAQLDSTALRNAVIAIGVLAAVLVALSVTMDKLTSSGASFDKGKFNIEGLRTGLVSIGIALVLIAAAAKMMSGIDDLTNAFKGLALLVATIAAVFASFGLLVKGKSAQNIDKAGKTILKLSVALMLMVGVCKLAGMLREDDIANGEKCAGLFVGMFVAISLISRFAGKNIDKAGSAILKMSIALGLMVGVCKLAGTLTEDDMTNGKKFAAGFIVFVGALVLITKIAKDKEITKLGGMLLGISAAMLLMVGVCKLAGQLEWGDMGKGAAFAAGFLVFVGVLVGITKIGSEEKIARVSATILAMSVAIGIMAGVCILLGLIDTGALIRGGIAVAVFGVVLSEMIKSLKGAEDVKGSIIAISVAIAVMAAALVALSFISWDKLMPAAVSLAGLMGMFALIAKMSSGLKGSTASLIVMTVAIGLLGGVIFALSSLPIESVIGVSASLSVLLLSLSASLFIIGKAGAVAPTALISIGVMTLVVAALAGILYCLRGLDPSNAIGISAALSVLLLSLSASCVILTLASATGPMALASAGVMTLVVAALAGILYCLRGLDPETAMGNAVALSTLLLALSGACVILEVAGLMGPAALIGVASLVALVVAVGTLIASIGALSEHFPKMEDFLDEGIPILEKIGYGLGSFFGNVVGGFADGVSSGLPGIGTNLSEFMTNLQPFIDGANTIDETTLTGISSLVKMVALISGASLIESLTSWLTGGTSMDSFADQLSVFADSIVDFSSKVSGKVDESAVSAAASAGKMMAEMSSTIPGTGGVVQWFCGEKDMAAFGDQLVAFGDAIVRFSDTVSVGINEEAVSAAANAGKIMSEMQDDIVPTGGVVQWFTGEKDMAEFGSQLVAFGESIVGFSEAVSNGINEEAVSAAANAGEIMTTMQDKLVSTGGVVQWFTGEKDMAEFGSQIVAFGEALTEFSENTTVDDSAVTSATNAGMLMAALQNAIPEKHWFDGKVELDDFGKKIISFGESIKKYSEKVSGVTDESVSPSLSAGTELVSLAKSMSDVDTDGISSFKDVKTIGETVKKYSDKVSGIDTSGVATSIAASNSLVSLMKQFVGLESSGITAFKKITDVGETMSSYSEEVSDINSSAVSTSISLAKRMVSLIESMSDINGNGAVAFKNAVDALADVNISSIVKSFDGSTGKISASGAKLSDALISGFKSNQSTLIMTTIGMLNAVQQIIVGRYAMFVVSGSTLISQFVNGILSQKLAVSNVMSYSVMVAANGLRGYYGEFYDTGVYLASGFANGINANTNSVTAKAMAMAEAAVGAIRKTLSIHSPSRVMYTLGNYGSQGFVNALADGIGDSYNAGSELALSAKNGLSKAISKVGDLIDGGVDVQPTISPVVDLSNVKRGADAISGYFSNKALVGVNADVNAISSSMDYRSQNGANDEVVSAINKLRKDLENHSGPSYTINGITYDDGTNISEAVKSLVRAARIERRV